MIMKGTEVFKQTILSYLTERAKNDDLFAKSFAKPAKSIDECINYILSEVRKSGCCGFADAEIFGMAVHYYDEDDIEVKKTQIGHVVVNHAVELTEEEKQEARDKAKQDFYNSELARQRTLNQPKKKVEVKVEQLSLFDI